MLVDGAHGFRCSTLASAKPPAEPGSPRPGVAGALWYHADHVRPSWRRDLTPGPKIGRHVFYGPTEDWRHKAVPGGTAANYTKGP